MSRNDNSSYTVAPLVSVGAIDFNPSRGPVGVVGRTGRTGTGTVGMGTSTSGAPLNIAPNAAVSDTNVLSLSQSDGKAALVIFDKAEDMPVEGETGAVLISDGIMYVRTANGLVNLGDALSFAKPEFPSAHALRDGGNDRRGAIAAQRRRYSHVESHGEGKVPREG